jgi:hypothetical protein
LTIPTARNGISPPSRTRSGFCPANSSSGCAEKFAPGSLLHYGQGKWYPGEPLPRWALAAYWRKDGVPIWKDDSLIADESKDYGHGAKEAKELLTRIARITGADPKYLLPAYEDAFYYTVEGAPLPVERHAGKIQSQGQAGARPHRADFPAGPWRGGRLRAADQARVVSAFAKLRQPVTAGCPARGFCATTTRSGSSPAIRRWACACRLIRFRGSRKRIIRGSGSRTRRSHNCRNCRRNFRTGAQTGDDRAAIFARRRRANPRRPRPGPARAATRRT